MPGQTGDAADGVGGAARASMEGRAIARPNSLRFGPRRRPMSRLQWRAEQLPGQTRRDRTRSRRSGCCFNGGPSNCPAKPSDANPEKRWSLSFNGGPSNCPAKLCRALAGMLTAREGFNGGPSNCPAKRGVAQCGPRSEGRFNGGPSNCPAKHQHVRRSASRRIASMEGRAIARPNSFYHVGRSFAIGASMEGRAIARPNGDGTLSARGFQDRFNGGPSNCPAKHETNPSTQPRDARFNGGPSNCPAKPTTTPTGQAPQSGFNGGPSNCPAKPDHRDEPARHRLASMEGRAIARPNYAAHRSGTDHRHASMEGRAIARPNRAPGSGRVWR